MTRNTNLIPRPLGTWLAGLVLKPWMMLLRKTPGPDAPSLVVFESYFVGDLFMAFSALRQLKGAPRLQVLCRPDCVALIRAEGFDALPFDNAFCMRPGLSTFFRTLRVAWALRGRMGPVALDFDCDSRSAFWLKIAGVPRVVSYRRPRAAFFDAFLPIAPAEIPPHYAAKNMIVARAYREYAGLPKPAEPPHSPQPSSTPSPLSSAGWLLSCWTRLDTKNWPLDRWELFLEKMQEAGIPFRIIEAPDGDEKFHAFRARWKNRVEFISGTLDQIAAEVRNSAGVVATDNFFGHMAAYYGKPVLWINGSSDPLLTQPVGDRSHRIQYDPMPCRPCVHRCVNPEYKACLNRLELFAVWEAFEATRG